MWIHCIFTRQTHIKSLQTARWANRTFLVPRYYRQQHRKIIKEIKGDVKNQP